MLLHAARLLFGDQGEARRGDRRGPGYVCDQGRGREAAKVLPTKTPRFRKSGAVGEAIKAFVAGARVLAGCCCRLGAGVPIPPFIFSYCVWPRLGSGLWASGRQRKQTPPPGGK